MKKQNREKANGGFTLLELLIVITIIAILSVALVFVLNPSETLMKSRDTQRLSDLSTLKTALGVFLTATSTTQLDGTSGTINDKCVGGTLANEKIWVSVPTAQETITDATPPLPGLKPRQLGRNLPRPQPVPRLMAQAGFRLN